jgi:hypothetical protein
MRRIQFDIDENDEATGVKTMSIVDDPAIDSNFVTLAKEVHYVEMQGPYKQILAGMALIPDKDIPRTSPKGEKFMAYFTPEGIERIRNKFHKELMTNRVNVDHKQNSYIDAYMVESFIVDSDHRLADVTAKGIKDPVMGSWFVAYKIEDKEIFSKALAGELKGFSVEIFIKNIFEKPKEIEVEAALNAANSALEAMAKKLDEVLSKQGEVVLVGGQFKVRGSDLIAAIDSTAKQKDKSYYEDKLKLLQTQLNGK